MRFSSNDLIYPIFDDLITPKRVIMAIVVNDEKIFELKSFVKFNNTSPYFRVKKDDKKFIDYIQNGEHVYLKKNLYKIYSPQELENCWDIDSTIWHLSENVPIIPKHFFEKYRLISVGEHQRHFESVINQARASSHNFNINTILQAQAILDQSFEGLNKFFNHYTKTGRFRDILSNTNSFTPEERQFDGMEDISYIDISGCHWRIMDAHIGGMIPQNEDPITFFIGDEIDYEKREKKKVELLTNVYAESFSFPHPFFTKLKLFHEEIESPFKREHDIFNYKIQEWEVLIVSEAIIQLNKIGLTPVTYHYDGLVIHGDKSKLADFIHDYKNPFNINLTWKIKT